MTTPFDMKSYFFAIADYVQTLLAAGEVSLANLSAEESNFVRFNKSAIRQAGSIKQIGLAISLIANRKRSESRLTLSGAPNDDRALVRNAVEVLRIDLADLPEDPYLLYNQTPESTDFVGASDLPSDAQMLDQILTAGKGKDLVGIFASGAIYKGFANSLGQRNWHRVDNFNCEWCLYHTADKAVKASYAGTHWVASEFEQKMALSATQLVILQRPAKSLAPGLYRSYLTPTALGEIISLLSWGGFGVKSQRTKQSPLIKLEDGSAALHASVCLTENAAKGIAPSFQSEGFIKTPAVDLIKNGQFAGSLISPRSAKEYALQTNGANGGEAPESMDMAAGTLDQSNVLSVLGTGLLIGNLWYLNYSERASCRMTGMTRFATFWVENGEIVAPLNVMRFDDSAYRLLGSNLVGLTAQRDWLMDSGSYSERSTGSARLPGALVNDFSLTL